MKSKINTMKSRPQVSDEEIQRYMNFDKLMLEKQRVDARRKTIKRLRIGGSAILLIGVITGIITFIPDKRSADRKLSAAKSSTALSADTASQQIAQEKNPVKKKTSDVKTDIRQSKPAIQHESERKQQAQPSDKPIADRSVKLDTGYIQAEPVNGYPDLYAYFDSELVYPKQAMSDPVEGVVTIAFTINRKGVAEQVKVENSLGELFDKEAIRVIEKMPAWKPARYKGKAVASKVSVPLTFQYRKIN
jgi:TonB family protein